MKKIGFKSLILLVAVVAGLSSCRKEGDIILSYGQNDRQAFTMAETSFRAQFVSLWTALNCNYGIWDYEEKFGLDWDAVKAEFEPQFAALDEKEEVTDEEFKGLYAKVLYPLHDGHLFVQVKNLSTGSFLGFSPSNNRNQSERAEDMQRDKAFTADVMAYSHMKSSPLEITESFTTDDPQKLLVEQILGVQSEIIKPYIEEGAPSADASEKDKQIYNYCISFDEEATVVSQLMYQDKKESAAIAHALEMVDKYEMLGSMLGFQLDPVDTSISSYALDVQYHLIEGSIPYIYISGFSLTPWLSDDAYAGLLPAGYPTTDAYRAEILAAWNGWMNAIASLKAENKLKGVIIDIRSNGGGMMNDFQYLVGALLPSGNFSYHKVRTKQGIGRLDYAPAVDFYFPTLEGDHTIVDDVPIVAMCNSQSVSMAEMSSAAVKSLPNGYLVGTRTWGGLCGLNTDPANYSMEYASVVGVKDVTSFFGYIPYMVSIFPGEGILEGVGVTPDIEVNYDPALHESTGRDTQLERAVDFILNGR